MNQIKNIDWQEILERLGGYATSEAGKQFLFNLHPLNSSDQAAAHCREIVASQSIIESGVRPRASSLDLYSIWFSRLQKGGTLKPLELKDLRLFCLELIALKEVLETQDIAWLKGCATRIMPASEPLSAIDHIMTADGDIRTDASEILYNLYNERSQQVKAAQNILDRLVKQHQMEPLLQERYVTNREGRWVLPIKSGMQHHFEGIIHASSHTKQTVYMEPQELIPLNNRLRQIEVEIDEEIERLLIELSKYLFTLTDVFAESREVLLNLDIRLAQAQLANHIEAHPVELSGQNLRLHNLRHPLLVLSGKDVIDNDVLLDQKQRILLLSGPNAGGKTVLLKAVGLAAQMARCGMPICASPDSQLPFFNDVTTAVGDAQSVDAQLSTFAAHLKILDHAAKQKGAGHLLLIDEICGSTDPDEGAALARGFIETYAENEVYAVITSHLGPLKLGWGGDTGVINGSLEYDNKTGRPTYQFLMGVPGQSLALQTAKRIGVQEDIIKRAHQHLSPDHQKYHLGLNEVENIKADLLVLKESMRQQQKELQKEKDKFNQLNAKFLLEKDKMLEQAITRAEKKIEKEIEHSRVDQVFKRHERLEKTKFELPEIVKAGAKATTIKRIESAEEFSKAFPPGAKVYIPSIARDGVVQSSANAKGEILVLSNSMRMTVSWEQLRPPQNSPDQTYEISRKVTGAAGSVHDNDRTIDVRGLTVEEAIAKLETQLDTAAVNKEDRVKIIHGHGTEALKRAIRSYLSRSVYIQKWNAGSNETGGDGVTWAELG